MSDEVDVLLRRRLETVVRLAVDRMAKYYGDRYIHVSDFLDDALPIALDEAIQTDTVLRAEQALLDERTELSQRLAARDQALAALVAALKAAQSELWQTYTDTPRLAPLFDQIEAALDLVSPSTPNKEP